LLVARVIRERLAFSIGHRMNEQFRTIAPQNALSGFRAVCGIAAFYRIPADPDQLSHQLGLGTKAPEAADLVRAANLIGLKARIVRNLDADRASRLPTPAIVRLRTGEFGVFVGRTPGGKWRLVDPGTHAARDCDPDAMLNLIEPEAILVTRQLRGPGVNPRTFGFRWFWPSLWRYRKPLAHVLVASLFVQVFALVTPLFFQVIVDKVLTHKSNATLLVLVIGMIVTALFDVVLQFLRTYALTHTTNRLDVELGQRLFAHLLSLPLNYFETRSAGQITARMRELETIRQFLTNQGLFSALDFVFAFVFVAVLFAYSWQLALIVVLSLPIYAILAAAVRPVLRERINDKFNRSAESNQFLVESVVGVHTIKASAIEPLMQVQWEEKLASYVTSAFDAGMLAAVGQNSIQYVSRVVQALVLLFGAWAVMDGSLSLGALIGFTMISGQAVQPILRLSQVWQDFQQVQTSIERLGDVLNFPPEARPMATPQPAPPRGNVEFKDVVFHYRPGAPEIIKGVSFAINAGEAIGIIGPSGSGKSTITKLIQRLYTPTQGRILLDGVDLTEVDPSWVRRNIGVVLQENVLFNRSIHENIALTNPGLPRSQVIACAKLAGAHEFIKDIPGGYDAIIEERGANLSGGQRQRLAIARALASNPPILIFDEATSALDYESERIIQKNMLQIMRNRTVIIVAHRLAAVQFCHRIISFADGRITEMGTPAELLKRPNGFYSTLCALQSGQAA
jgi:subfamily B ATP-binding cassette protein HlyB/CyaB